MGNAGSRYQEPGMVRAWTPKPIKPPSNQKSDSMNKSALKKHGGWILNINYNLFHIFYFNLDRYTGIRYIWNNFLRVLIGYSKFQKYGNRGQLGCERVYAWYYVLKSQNLDHESNRLVVSRIKKQRQRLLCMIVLFRQEFASFYFVTASVFNRLPFRVFKAPFNIYMTVDDHIVIFMRTKAIRYRFPWTKYHVIWGVHP